MIFVDGKKLGDGNSPEEQFYRKKKKELEADYKWPLRIRDRRAGRVNATGFKETKKSYAFSFMEVVADDLGHHEWRYSTGYPAIDRKTGRERYPVRYLQFKEELIIDKKDIDLAFFLVFRSNILTNTSLYIVDSRKEADAYANSKRNMAGLAFALWEEESPIYDDDDAIRTIALALGITRSDDKEAYTLNEVKVQIEQAVVEGEKVGDQSCNYAVFKEASKLGESVKNKALIQKAIDKKVIGFDDLAWTFFLLDAEGNQKQRLLKIDGDSYHRKENILVDFLNKNLDIRERIEGGLGEKFHVEEMPSYEEIMDMEPPALKEIGKMLKVKTVGVKVEDIRESILEKLNLVKQ